MRLPRWFLSVLCAAVVGGEGWIITKLVKQGEDIAAIKAALISTGYHFSSINQPTPKTTHEN
jgi:hypothetical protein